MNTLKVAVITISDRASRGEYKDLSGPEIERMIKEAYPACEIGRMVVPDEKRQILNALEEVHGCDFILTTGGTGISPRDITPEVTRDFCDRELPGIAEIIRLESYRETPMAMLSRGYAGCKEKTVVINFPGSLKAVRCCTRVVIPIMEHAVRMFRGEGH